MVCESCEGDSTGERKVSESESSVRGRGVDSAI